MKDNKLRKRRVEFPARGDIIECSKCKRKILVERVLFGVDHTLGIIATCWDCLNEKTRKRAKKMYKLKLV